MRLHMTMVNDEAKLSSDKVVRHSFESSTVPQKLLYFTSVLSVTLAHNLYAQQNLCQKYVHTLLR